MKTHFKRHGRCVQPSRRRRGGVMLLCMLAAVVIAASVLGLAQSHRQRILRIDSRRATIQATQASSGLFQRAIAVLKNDPAFSGRIDPATKTALGGYAIVQPLKTKSTSITVYAYDAATTPALQQTVDPTTL